MEVEAGMSENCGNLVFGLEVGKEKNSTQPPYVKNYSFIDLLTFLFVSCSEKGYKLGGH